MPNSLRLPEPGCIPENGEVEFTAPTGGFIQGALQDDSATWSVFWSDRDMPETFEYGDGPGGADWNDVTIGGQIVWMDEAGESWLSRHLIPSDRPALPEEAKTLAQRDYLAAEALDLADKLCLVLDQGAALAPEAGAKSAGPVAELAALAHRVKELAGQQSGQLETAWTRALEAATPDEIDD